MNNPNQAVADRLREAADLLALQGADPFRVDAYRHAADTVARLPRDICQLTETEGLAGLISLPHIGRGIAAAIAEMVATGRWARLDRLRGELDPEQLLQSVPGIGPVLAAQFHDTLHIDSLEALEVAAHDGRLEGLPGIGRRRVAALQASLAAMLGRTRTPRQPGIVAPSVEALLEVDGEYRKLAERGQLPTIAPRRFNPEGKSWLPVLHTEHGDWHFTALFSNTARAHKLGRTRDWVVIYYYDHSHREDQCTVVTETRGALRGQRVVRGREEECGEFRARVGQASAKLTTRGSTRRSKSS
ncbi:MAG: helix-hairpin-helix domain-containing protein [Gammaproteobacteria bacterium]|nr:helix-hairpin-helix domain-containing protein [Gammaproteobacteria bacterium]